ncbi:MAG TPA: DUF2267 domain-containing protein [Candidatus Paceibacterota bacterium]|nr:DUF2267 domain-containing protein [Candidatus Paceibacterota bacterium]
MTQGQKQLQVFQTTLQKTHEMVKAVNDRFSWEDEHKAYLALRSILQTLRDRLTIENAASLGAQLPMLVRGFYFEGWKPQSAPIKMNRAEFVGEVERVLEPPFDESTEDIIKGVLAIVESYTDPAEMRKIKKTLPKDIVEMLGP